MPKHPASEQPTQLTIREITADTSPPERPSLSNWIHPWLLALCIIIPLCIALGLGGSVGVRSVVGALDSGEPRVIYEVVERQQPVTVASTTGELAAVLPLSPIFTPEVQFWGPLIAEWAKAWEIDPNLIATVIQIESCGDPFVSSSAGAQGLFQVMPFHFDPGEDMLDIRNNAARGLAYLSGGLDRSQGNAGLALAGYNGGHSVISRGYGAWYPETRRYYYWGAGIYEDASAGLTSSDRLQEWLTAGGQGLCDRARVSQQNYSIQTGG